MVGEIDITTKVEFLKRLSRYGYPYNEVWEAFDSAPHWEQVKFLMSLGKCSDFVGFIINLRRYGE